MRFNLIKGGCDLANTRISRKYVSLELDIVGLCLKSTGSTIIIDDIPGREGSRLFRRNDNYLFRFPRVLTGIEQPL